MVPPPRRFGGDISSLTNGRSPYVKVLLFFSRRLIKEVNFKGLTWRHDVWRHGVWRNGGVAPSATKRNPRLRQAQMSARRCSSWASGGFINPTPNHHSLTLPFLICYGISQNSIYYDRLLCILPGVVSSANSSRRRSLAVQHPRWQSSKYLY